MRALSSFAVLAALASLPVMAAHAQPAAAPHEFLDDARALLVVGACAEGALPATVDAKLVAAHCTKVRAAQADYRTRWVARARAFFAEHVPASVPKTVVYPFAGGDLSTALTVYPDADEITTLSLEPAGDPRALGRLDRKRLQASLATVATELSSLYRSNFSVTMNMIGAMRGGQLPTQLIFSLSALTLHDYELHGVRYFKLTPEGDVRYVTTAELDALAAVADAGTRNRALSNVELRFRKRGGRKQQVYRHIMANLDDAHLVEDPSALKHLAKKGEVAAMTKAASYLLSFAQFATMRRYVIEHVAWMVSDTTGLPPKYGEPAGFAYETHGAFETANMKAGGEVAPAWRKLFAAQPRRPLPFRFGYPDGKWRGHLVIMRKAPAATKATEVK